MARHCRKKRCPNPNTDPSRGVPTVIGFLGLPTSDEADRLNIYQDVPDVQGGGDINGFNITNDAIGIYVGTYSVPSIFNNVGLAPNAAILESQFKQIGDPLSLVLIDPSDRLLYNVSTGELFSAQPQVAIIFWGEQGMIVSRGATTKML
jgi:hypothetical protein